MIDLKKVFDAVDGEFLHFERVENPLHQRPDICAFLYLDRLVPGNGRDMVGAAEHDEIYLDVNCDKLAEVASDEDILMLYRCGVRYDAALDCLAMFV